MEMKPDSTPEPDVRIIGVRRFSLSFVIWHFEDISLSCRAVKNIFIAYLFHSTLTMQNCVFEVLLLI